MFDAAGTSFADPDAAARKAGLRYVSDEATAGLSRARHGTGFRYTDAGGRPYTTGPPSPASARSRSRQPGPRSGSRPIRTRISSPPAAT